MEANETLKALRTHKWIGRQLGGSPAEAGSYEWVRYCSVCGMEDTCEDDLPPCPGEDVTQEQREEEIRRVEEEIAFIANLGFHIREDGDFGVAIRRRILAREEEVLADLKKGDSSHE